MTKSKVYFVAADQLNGIDHVKEKLTALIEQSGTLKLEEQIRQSVIKIHFGEVGNTGYVRPEYVRLIHDAIADKVDVSLVSDTNTLYQGRRVEAHDHTQLAYEHGFTEDVVGAKVFIPDERVDGASTLLDYNAKYIKGAHLGSVYLDSDLFIAVTHFKGHMMAGFGGAVKNIAMGCATRPGKMAQHSSVAPKINKSCVACGLCLKACQVNAIEIKRNRAKINSKLCTGCASCIAVCPHKAIDVDWMQGALSIQNKMAEYADAFVKNTKAKTVYFNFALKITKDCDCMAKDDPRIIDDIGVFVSDDPVAIDKACYDKVKEKANGKDLFRKNYPLVNGLKHLRYAAKLGAGSLDYDLIEVK